jgi:hypothetical protein
MEIDVRAPQRLPEFRILHFGTAWEIATLEVVVAVA